MASKIESVDPPYVVQLAQAYGGPSQNAFGSAVFFQPSSPQVATESLEQFALKKYQYFCGKTWERFGESNWLGTWSQVFVRPTGASADIVEELKSLTDSNTQSSASLLLDPGTIPNGDQLLGQAFDGEDVTELRIFKIGDGEAMSGVLIAANRPAGAFCLLILMD